MAESNEKRARVPWHWWLWMTEERRSEASRIHGERQRAAGRVLEGPWPWLWLDVSKRHDARGVTVRRGGARFVAFHTWKLWAPKRGKHARIPGFCLTVERWGFHLWFGHRARGGVGKHHPHGPWPRWRLGISRNVNAQPYGFA